MSKIAWLVALGLVACGEDELTPSQLQARTERECAQRTVVQCQQDEACSVIQGRRADPDCADREEDLGCHAAGTICGEALTLAEDTQGQTWWFGNTCIPTGFVFVSPPTSQARDGRCGEVQPGGRDCSVLDSAACKRDEGCRVISGLRVDREHRCLGDSAELSCTSKALGCTAALVIGTDLQGQAWYFTGGGAGCVPQGYADDGGDPAVNWNLCNPPAAPLPKPCEELHPDHCDEQDNCATVDGLVFEPETHCVRGPKNAFCIDKDTSCPPAIMYARNPADGYSFELPSGCKPQSWTRLTPSETPSDSWPACSN